MNRSEKSPKNDIYDNKESNICIFFEPFRRRWFLRSLDRLDDNEKLINLFIPFYICIYSLLITSDTGLVFKYNICVLDRSKY